MYGRSEWRQGNPLDEFSFRAFLPQLLPSGQTKDQDFRAVTGLTVIDDLILEVGVDASAHVLGPGRPAGGLCGALARSADAESSLPHRPQTVRLSQPEDARREVGELLSFHPPI